MYPILVEPDHVVLDPLCHHLCTVQSLRRWWTRPRRGRNTVQAAGESSGKVVAGVLLHDGFAQK